MSRGFRVRPPWPINPECGGKTHDSTEGPPLDPGATRGAPTERAEIHRAANPDRKENRFPQRREARPVLLPTDPTMAVLQENPIEEDRPLLREQALVDGLLVRKYKVLLEMQRERRRAKAEEGEVEWDFASLGLGGPEPEGGLASRPKLRPAALPEDDGKIDV
jgi:hypothetical protein